VLALVRAVVKRHVWRIPDSSPSPSVVTHPTRLRPTVRKLERAKRHSVRFMNHGTLGATATKKWRIVTSGISGGQIAHAVVSRRPPIPLYTMVPRTEGYACDVEVWDSSIVQGPFSFAPCQTLVSRFATFSSLYALFSVYVVDPSFQTSERHDSQLLHRCNAAPHLRASRTWGWSVRPAPP
jgi:hypothetical protein